MSDADPQIGALDVKAEALLGAGTSLESLLAEVGAHLETASAEDAPSEGWRVLREDESGAVTIGAPADPSATTWYIAQIGVDQHGQRRTTTSVYPEAMPVRRSRAERAKGLALRWPPLSRSEAEDDVFVIDIVNMGDSRWRPDGDPFAVFGVLAIAGTDETGVGFGFFAGQHPAVPLDPGEYARVRISINERQWEDLEPGRYELRAGVAALPVTPPSPLTIELTREQIDRHRSLREARSRTPVDARASLSQRRQYLQAVIEGASRFDLIASLVADAATDEAAKAEVARLLPADDDVVTTLIGTPLGQFSKEAVQRMRDQVRQIDGQLAALRTEG